MTEAKSPREIAEDVTERLRSLYAVPGLRLSIMKEAADAIDNLLSYAAERERLLDEALTAIERLGASETFTIPFARKAGNPGDDELVARIEFARAAHTRLSSRPATEGKDFT